MKIVYFPFTHVPVQDRVALGTFFKEVFFVSSDPEQTWSPMSFPENRRFPGRQSPLPQEELPELPDGPRLNLLPFPRELREPVVRLLADHRQWAAHSGAGPGQLKTLLRKTPYFTSDTQVSAIQSRIRKETSSGGSREEPADTLLRSLVFLCLARESDEQNAAIEAALSTVNEKKKRLFSTLNGEFSPAVSETDSSDVCGCHIPLMPREDMADPGALMTPIRLRSWFRVFKEVVPDDWQPFILVTTSPAVVAFFEQIAPGGKLLLDKGEIYVHKETCVFDSALQDQVMADIKAVVSGTGDKGLEQGKGETETAFSRRLRLYHFKGGEINRFFCREGKETCSPPPDFRAEQGLFICLVCPGK